MIQVNKPIPYYPDLEDEIYQLGFKTFDDVVMFLANIKHMDFPIRIKHYRSNNIDREMRYLQDQWNDIYDDGFIFTMSDPYRELIDIVYIGQIDKNKFIKILSMRTFI